MESGSTVACLRRWLELATALQRELGHPNPDEEVVSRLLGERARLQHDLTHVMEAAADSETRPLVQAILETDRASMEQARRHRNRFAALLAHVRSGYQLVSGYRRALGNLSRQSGAFVDHCV